MVVGSLGGNQGTIYDDGGAVAGAQAYVLLTGAMRDEMASSSRKLVWRAREKLRCAASMISAKPHVIEIYLQQ